jgi:N-acetyl-anhydromuramyl-L-alanine amidase AmpD
MVDEKDVAWHATYYNRRSIGIEVAGWSHKPETWNGQNSESLVRLVADVAVRHGVLMVHPEGDAVTQGGRFHSPGIVGHGQIQTPGSEGGEKSPRTDPGPYFPWKEFIHKVRREAQAIQASR